MRLLGFFLISLLFICAKAEAFERYDPIIPKDKTFLQNWQRSKLYTNQDQSGSFQSMSLSRWVTLRGAYRYQVGHVTYQKLPTSVVGKMSSEELKESIAKGYAVKNILSVNENGEIRHEFFWEQGNRVIRYLIKQDKISTHITVANFRRGYSDSLYPETLVIQKKLVASKGKKRTSFLNFIAPEAYANNGLNIGPLLDNISPEDIQNGGNGGNGGNGDNPLGGLSDGRVDVVVSGGVTGTGSVDPETLEGIDGIVQGGADRADQVVQDSLDGAQVIVDDVQGTITTTSDMVDRNWSDTNAEFARANDLAEKMADPKYAALLAGATAAGAVVGASVANLAIAGVQLGMEWMIEQITGAKAREERWKLFQEARENWEATSRHARDLENSIDRFLLFHDTIKKLKENFDPITIEEVIRHFMRERLIVERRITKLKTNFLSAPDQCVDAYADKIADEELLATSVGQILANLQDFKNNSGGVNIFDERYFCDQLGSMVRKLLEAETLLQRYRIYMIDGQQEFKEAVRDELVDLQGRADRFRDSGAHEMDAEIEAANDLLESQRAGLRDQLADRCNQENQTFFAGSCVDEYLARDPYRSQFEQFTTAYERRVAFIRARGAERSGDPIGVNQTLVSQHIQAMDEWFSELEDQQRCSQNPDDPACAEMSKFKFNGSFPNKRLALGVLEDVCPEQNLSLGELRAEIERQNADLPETETSGTEIARQLAQVAQGGTGSSLAEVASTDSASGESGGGFFAAIGDFFSGIVEAFGSIFSAIGEFFGFGSSSIGENQSGTENVVVTRPDQVVVNNDERLPAGELVRQGELPQEYRRDVTEAALTSLDRLEKDFTNQAEAYDYFSNELQLDKYLEEQKLAPELRDKIIDDIVNAAVDKNDSSRLRQLSKVFGRDALESDRTEANKFWQQLYSTAVTDSPALKSFLIENYASGASIATVEQMVNFFLRDQLSFSLAEGALLPEAMVEQLAALSFLSFDGRQIQINWSEFPEEKKSPELMKFLDLQHLSQTGWRIDEMETLLSLL